MRMHDDHRRRIVLPDEPTIADTIGRGAPTKRALRARLRRAEDAGIWPRRVYLSSQRYGYYGDEVDAALERLPRAHVETLREGE